jgi:hypothetical protein
VVKKYEKKVYPAKSSSGNHVASTAGLSADFILGESQ